MKINPDDFELVLRKCSVYEKSGDLPKALKTINDFISSRKDNNIPEYLMERGILYSKCGYPHQAIRDFSELNDETDCLITAYEWRFKEYEKIGDFAKVKQTKRKYTN